MTLAQFTILLENNGTWYLEPRLSIIRESGLAVIEPLVVHNWATSVFRFGISTDFYTSNGFIQKRIDSQPKLILSCFEEMDQHLFRFVVSFLIVASLAKT